MIESHRYKLRMFGIPIDNPTYVFCDNQSVITNSTTPGSKLKKKHVSISYHRVRESIASGIIKIAYIPSKDNLADVLTKMLGGPQLRHLCQAFLSWDNPKRYGISFLFFLNGFFFYLSNGSNISIHWRVVFLYTHRGIYFIYIVYIKIWFMYTICFYYLYH